MRILIIEDNQKMATSLKKMLELERYAVDVCHEGKEGLDKALFDDIDLVILDLGLPDLDGIEISRKIREEKKSVPILMLTAKDSVQDNIIGLDSGADDYLIKPFNFAELLARVRSLIRRSSNQPTLILSSGNLTLDPISHIVKRGNKEIVLTAKEYALLEFMLRNAGQILSKTQLLDHVWDSETDPFSNTVDVYVGYLRNKIDKVFPSEQPLIETTKGLGYKIKK